VLQVPSHVERPAESAQLKLVEYSEQPERLVPKKHPEQQEPWGPEAAWERSVGWAHWVRRGQQQNLAQAEPPARRVQPERRAQLVGWSWWT